MAKKKVKMKGNVKVIGKPPKLRGFRAKAVGLSSRIGKMFKKGGGKTTGAGGSGG